VIDRVVDGPVDGDEARALADRWFGLSTTKAHCRNGQALLAMAKGIDACRGDFVLHADVDVLVGRPAPDHDHIAETIDLFREAPEAVSIALPVHGDDDRRPRCSDDRGPFRIETQVGWLHRQRLLSLLPLPNDLDGGALALPWHRALDRVVRSGGVESIRRGSPGIWFTSPDNARKENVDDHLLLLDRIEDGHAPDVQRGRAATSGSLAQWLGPRRREPMVIVACGRNVGPGRIARFRDALLAQSYEGWGAIVIDDASDDGTHESIHRAFADVRGRVTLIRRRRRMGALENLELAARRFIERPDAIVVLLDLDDALGHRDALAEIAAAHQAGADVTVGSMIRTDKQITYPVDFHEPRARRGGNVWQHVRAFRRSLFDRIEPADLRLQGARIDRATDWAYMLPIVEMADAPRWLRSPLYLYEPGTERTAQSRAVREPIIARLLARPRYSRGHRPSSVDHLTVVAHHRVVRDDASDPVTAIYRRRGMAVTATAFEAQIRTLLRRFEPVSLDEALAAAHGVRALPENALLLTFDDGYTDFAEVALPILERLGAPVALFARVPCDDGWPTWAPLDAIYLGLGRGGVVGNAHICPDAREKLLRLAVPQQHAIARACVALPDDALGAARRALYLSDRQIREVVTRGVGLGAPGVEHVRWWQLSRMALAAELSASREWLQSLGVDAAALAYPDGAVNRATALAAERAGFVLGLGLHEKPVGVPTALAVRRWLAGIEEDWAERVPAGDEEKAS
jgi:peptidoglycan/xylan/chitin deacetylase (PgdA/CDA1 family)